MLALEEEYWVMKSRIGFLVNGDHSTSFYHTLVLARRRNKIVSLKNNNGEWICEEAKVANHIRQGFISSHTSSMECGYRRPWDIPNWQVRISQEDAN